MEAETLRKAASLESGKRFLESYGEPVIHPVALARLHKMAEADPELLKIAAWCSAGDILDMYDALGGEYMEKEAVSQQWIQNKVQSASQLSNPARIDRFALNMDRKASNQSSLDQMNKPLGQAASPMTAKYQTAANTADLSGSAVRSRNAAAYSSGVAATPGWSSPIAQPSVPKGMMQVPTPAPTVGPFAVGAPQKSTEQMLAKTVKPGAVAAAKPMMPAAQAVTAAGAPKAVGAAAAGAARTPAVKNVAGAAKGMGLGKAGLIGGGLLGAGLLAGTMLGGHHQPQQQAM